MTVHDFGLTRSGPDQPQQAVRPSLTLSVYIARHALTAMLIALMALGLIAVVIDLIELLRRAGSRPEATFGVVFTMAWLHLPFFLQQLLPFAVLFGTMFGFQRLTRSHELVAARAIGVSVWQFLTPALGVALTLGVLSVTVFNPIGAILVSKYETMERIYFSHRASMVAVSQGGLWLRQTHPDGGEVLLHARQMSRNPPTLTAVTVFFYDQDNRFTARADAEAARLEAGNWMLVNPVHSMPDGNSQTLTRLSIPTDLTPDRIKDSFEAPRDHLLLGPSGLHRTAGGGRFFRDRAPSPLASSLVPALSPGGHAVDRRHVLAQAGAPGWYRNFDRRWLDYRLCLLHSVGRNFRAWPFRPLAADLGGLDACRGRDPPGRDDAFASGRRLSDGIVL